jgi:hypothetical protein
MITRRTRNRLHALGATPSVLRGLLLMSDLDNYRSVDAILRTLSTDLDVLAARRWAVSIQPEQRKEVHDFNLIETSR